MLSRKDFQTKKNWRNLLFLGVSLEVLSLFTEREFAISLFSLLFSFLLYMLCYMGCRTWPLTLTLWIYPFIFLGLCGALAMTILSGNTMRHTQIGSNLDFWSIASMFFGIGYLGYYLVLTWKMRKINKRLSFGPHSH